MNPQKRLIQEGERHLAEKKGFLERIQKLNNGDGTGVSVAETILIDIEKAKLMEQVTTITQRLEKLQKEFVQSFEAESAEVNQKLGGALMLGQKLIGQEPLAITEKIGVLVERLKVAEDQEQKNDDFYEMMGHINFIKTKVK